MQVSVKAQVAQVIKDFNEEFDTLDDIEKTMENITSEESIESISSAIEEFISNLQEIVDDTTVRLEELDSFEEDE